MRLLPLTLATTAFSASIFPGLMETLQQAISVENSHTALSLEHEVIALHKDLVDIKSISGDELTVGEYLNNYLTQHGFTVENQKVSEGRENIYAYFGSKKNTKVLLTSHMDTVPPYFPYYISGDRIYGRGTSDAKGSVASMIMAARALKAEGSVGDGDLALLFVVGEEHDGTGMLYASDHLDATWDHAVFGEPTEMKLGVGHKGMVSFEMNITGKASHSGYPHLGIDANKKMIDILYEIEHTDFPTDELLGNTTVNAGLITAGVAGNVVSPHAFTKCLIRVAHGAEYVYQTVKAIIDKADEEFNNISVKWMQHYEPVYLDYEVPGFDSIVLAYFTDIPGLKRDFKSRYLYGPGSILVAHSADEYIKISDLTEAIGGYKRLAKFLLT